MTVKQFIQLYHKKPTTAKQAMLVLTVTSFCINSIVVRDENDDWSAAQLLAGDSSYQG